jgi:hypothetical protein
LAYKKFSFQVNALLPLFHGPNPLGKRNTTPVNLLDSVPKIPFSHFVIFVKAPVIYLIIDI